MIPIIREFKISDSNHLEFASISSIYGPKGAGLNYFCNQVRFCRFIFDLCNEQRQIIASMAEFFPNPSGLVGKEMPLLLNIESRNFKGHQSQRMIIAADTNGRPFFFFPEEELPPGSLVR